MLRIRENVLGSSHMETLTSYYNLAIFQERLRQEEQAEQYYKKALSSRRAALDDLALRRYPREAWKQDGLSREIMDHFLGMPSRREGMAKSQFEEVFRWTGDALIRQRLYHQVAGKPELAPLVKALQNLALREATLMEAVPQDSRQIAAWRDQVAKLTRKKQELIAELSRQGVAIQTSKTTPEWAEFIKSLPENSAFVTYVEFKQSQFLRTPFSKEGKWIHVPWLTAFVVSNDGAVHRKDLGPAGEIYKAIDRWLATQGTTAGGEDAGNALREKLWEPVLSLVKDKNLILVSADHGLGRLPWGALPGEKPGTFLLEDHRLVLLPVPQLLPRLLQDANRPKSKNGLLIVGPVDARQLDQNAPARAQKPHELQAMPRNRPRDEAANVERLYKAAFDQSPKKEIRRLSGIQATEKKFRELASLSNQIHLHLRRIPLPNPPELPHPAVLDSTAGLAFNHANKDPLPARDNGVLTVEEMLLLPLEGVDLIVLSLDETGPKPDSGRVEIYGMQRALQMAGAGSTLAGLRAVSQPAKQQFLERFYENLWQKRLSKLDALREAQLWALKHPKQFAEGIGIHSKVSRTPPYCWASFQISGDWR